MSKTVKWILISLVILVALLGVLKAAGVFGKDLGTKVSAEKAQKRTITEFVNASGKNIPRNRSKSKPGYQRRNNRTGRTGRRQCKKRTGGGPYFCGYLQHTGQPGGKRRGTKPGAGSQLPSCFRGFPGTNGPGAKKHSKCKSSCLPTASLVPMNLTWRMPITGVRWQITMPQNKAFVAGRAAVQSAQSNLAKANKDLSRTAVLAPMDGVVSLLSVKKGERVVGSNMMAGTEMLRIADMAKIEIRVDVSESDIPKVHLDDSAIVTVDAYSDRKFKGIVTQIASSNNGAATQTALANTSTDVTNYKVYIRLLPGSYTDLLGKGTFPFRPGMSASADIQTKTHVNALSVPINAVTTREKNDSTKKNSHGSSGAGRCFGQTCRFRR